MTCNVIRQNDEWTCNTCGLRWPVDEDAPACAEKKDDSLLQIAMAISGPFMDKWTGRPKLLEVRKHKWFNMLSGGDRRLHVLAAKSVVRELQLMSEHDLQALLKRKMDE